MAQNGASILLLVRTSTGPDVYTVMGGQRDLSIDESVAEIDGSSKDGPEGRVDGGRYGSSLSLEELYVPSDAAYAAIKAAFRSRTKVKVRVQENGASTEEAMALITSLSRNFPDQGESTVSIDMTIDGAWSAVV